MMSRLELIEQERREDIICRQTAWICIILCVIGYFIIFIAISDDLWHSYAESSCFVVNSTVVERQCCLRYQSKPVFDAVWVVDVHPNIFHFIRYLADIRQEFDGYYKAYEYILTFHRVSIDSCQFNHLMCTFLDWLSTTLLCAHKE